MVHHYFLKNHGKEAKTGLWSVIGYTILIEGGFLEKRETWVDLKCEGKEPSVSDKLIIDVIGFIKISIQSFTRLVGNGVIILRTSFVGGTVFINSTIHVEANS